MHVRAITVSLLALCALVSAQAKTYALIVGVSKYGKLPHDLWLQYPDADANTFAKFLASPQGGAVPDAQVKLLTNEQATTRALREAFKGFLQTPGKEDTIYILIAGHGTADSHGAFILTYDADPADLSTTAMPMGELRALVEQSLTRAGRVVFLVDVCRAAAVAGQKAVGDTVAKFGEATGEMLGLMAARPTELSNEGPEYGGGHGAFTYSVLKGLTGAADTDKDGFVTAGELIDFVTTNVPKLTTNKQHPRDLGDMENSTKLSDLSKPGITLP